MRLLVICILSLISFASLAQETRVNISRLVKKAPGAGYVPYTNANGEYEPQLLSNYTGGGGNFPSITDDSTTVSISDSSGILSLNKIGSAYTWNITGSDRSFTIGESTTGQNLQSTGVYNFIIGYQSGQSLTTGDDNFIMGYLAGNAITTEGRNVFIGAQAGQNATSANQVSIGDQAGQNATDIGMISIGQNAGKDASGNGVVSIGTSAGSNWIGNYGIAIGYQAGYQSGNTSSSANSVLIGYRAGGTGGIDNIYIGNQAGRSNTSGRENIGLGALALNSNTTGLRNVAIGESAGKNITTGDYNMLMGYQSGNIITTGNSNVCINFRAGFNIGSGSDNILIGSESGYNTADVDGNMFLGYRSGYANTSGAENTYIGYRAGHDMTTGSGNIIIGRDNEFSDLTWSNRLNISNLIYATGLTTTGSTVSPGNVGIGVEDPQTARLEVDGNIKTSETAMSSTPSLFAVFDNGVIKTRTLAEMQSDLGANDTNFGNADISFTGFRTHTIVNNTAPALRFNAITGAQDVFGINTTNGKETAYAKKLSAGRGFTAADYQLHVDGTANTDVASIADLYVYKSSAVPGIFSEPNAGGGGIYFTNIGYTAGTQESAVLTSGGLATVGAFEGGLLLYGTATQPSTTSNDYGGVIWSNNTNDQLYIGDASGNFHQVKTDHNNAYGSCYSSGGGVGVSAANQNQWYIHDQPSTQNLVNNFTHTSGGKLEYSGSETINVQITVTGYVYTTNGADTNWRIGLGHNGTYQSGTSVELETPVNNDRHPVSVSWQMQLAQNDDIQMMFSRTNGAAADSLIMYTQMTIHEL